MQSPAISVYAVIFSLLRICWYVLWYDKFYDMLIVKRGYRTRLKIWQVQHDTFSPNGAIMTLSRVTGKIEIAQPLLNFLTRTPLKMSVYSDYMQELWYFSESKTTYIVVGRRCLFLSSLFLYQTCYFRKHARIMYNITRKYMHAETLALLTKPLCFPNMKYLK
jgi:hypothetical protein